MLPEHYCFICDTLFLWIALIFLILWKSWLFWLLIKILFENEILQADIITDVCKTNEKILILTKFARLQYTIIDMIEREKAKGHYLIYFKRMYFCSIKFWCIHNLIYLLVNSSQHVVRDTIHIDMIKNYFDFFWLLWMSKPSLCRVIHGLHACNFF